MHFSLPAALILAGLLAVGAVDNKATGTVDNKATGTVDNKAIVQDDTSEKQVEPAYFYISEGEDKCFGINAPLSVPITAAYHNRDNQGVQCTIYYKDPQHHVVFSRQVGHSSPKGKVSFLTKQEGDHFVCISCPTSQWFAISKIKWSLSVELADPDTTLSEGARKDDMDDLEDSLDTILRRLDIHSAENAHQRVQEDHFHQTSESASFRFLLFAVVKIVVLVLCTLFSVYHLTRFFRSQKLL
eukprot:Lankesteria_metandrocarpae@DN604_c0_g1_i1.p1